MNPGGSASAIDMEPIVDHSTPGFQFIDTQTYQPQGPGGGVHYHQQRFPEPAKDSMLGSSSTTQSATGARRFLESKGFGWMLNAQEIEEDIENSPPLLEELDIDLKDIYYKLRCVLLPLPYFRLKLHHVRDSPDFWGPLFVVLCYALFSLYGQFQVVSWILTVWFVGSYVVFFIARVLGGEVTYSACLGVIGYCLIPLVFAAAFLPLLARVNILRYVFACFFVAWSVYSAGTLLCRDELEHRKALVLYPIFLLYVYFLSLYTGV